MSSSIVVRMLATAIAGAFVCSAAQADVLMSGPLPQGRWENLLHLGADYTTDLLSTGDGQTIVTDCLADYGGEANQNPYPGLVYSGFHTKTASKEPPHQLTWTPLNCPGGLWQSAGQDSYISYWHIYVNVPGTESRAVRFYLSQDDDVRIWNNGTLIVDSRGYCDASQEKAPFDATLVPGRNSITIKLYEGSGGDHMAIRMTDANGKYFDDLTFQLLPSSFKVANPVTGSSEFTSSAEVKVAELISDALDDEYQISLDPDPANLPDDGWRAFQNGMLIPGTITLSDAGEGATNHVYAFTRHLSGDPATNTVAASIVYTSAAPTASARNASIMIDSVGGTAVDPDIIDAGSSDDLIGIFKRWVTPATITGEGTVTLHVMNNAGVEATASAYVSCSGLLDVTVAIDGNDAFGSGRPESPWRTVTYALAHVVEGGTVYMNPGTYTTDESFPLSPEGATIVGIGDVALDANNGATHIFECTNGTLSVSNVDLRNTTLSAVCATGSVTMVFADCAFTQSLENKGEGNNGAFDLFRGANVTVERCSFTGIKRFAVVQDHSGSTFTAEDCLFQGNNLGHSTFNYQWQSASYLYLHGCQFLDNVTPQSAAHDAAYSVISYFDGCPYIEVDRCVAANNKTGNVIGFRNVGNSRVSNCLFVNNEALEGVFEGYNSPVNVYNCTFIGNHGGYSGYNITTTIKDSIIMGDTKALTFDTPRGFSANAAKLNLVNTILCDANEGKGYNTSGSTVIKTDPILENVVAAWGDPAFDPRPRPYSPAIDAGDNSTAFGAIDVDGNARIADNNGDGKAVVDIGCHESLFHAAVEPTFTVPVPGSLAGYRGIEYSIPVSIDPAPSSDVTAAVTYDEGLTGDATLSFTAGSPTATLNFTIGAERVDFARITITESGTDAGVLPAVFDVFPGDLVLTVDNRLRTFVRTGETFDLPVSLALDGAVAPGDIALALGDTAGDGSNVISWQGDDVIRIPSGKHASVGAVHVAGGNGLNAVTISSGATFSETEGNSVTVEFVGYPGYVYVDPQNGSDSNIGSLAEPFQSIGAAIAAVQAGDEVRLLPGDYTTETENFPINPANVAVVGYGEDGVAIGDPAEHVINANNASANAFAYENATAGEIRNVAVCETTDAAIYINSSIVAVSNAVFTQSIQNKGANGGILLHNNPTVTIEDCVFTGMTRRATVFFGGNANNNAHTLTANRCLFADNDSEYATVAGEHGPAVIFYAYFTDCIFRDNAVTPSNNQISDAYRATALFGRTSGRARFTRCQFLGGREGTVFGMNYFGGNNNGGNSEFTIDDCLFAGNYAPAGMFHGYNSNPVLRNCTFTGNTGGYNGRNVQPTFKNCIICGDGQASFIPPDGAMEYRQIVLQDTILWDTEEGTPMLSGWDGTVHTATNYIADYATNLLRVDPRLRSPLSYDAENIPDWEDADVRLLSSSPAIDAGNNANAAAPLDVFGGDRIKIGLSRNEEAIVDLGCFESDLVISGTVLILK